MKLKNQNYFDGVYHLKNEIVAEKEEEQSQKPKEIEKKKPSRKKKGE